MSEKKSSKSEFSSVSNSKLAKLAEKEKWSVKRDELDFLDKGESPFAKGAGGKLYRVRWRGLVCACKAIHFEFNTANESEQDRVIEDLENEIALLSSLRHPHLVMFLGASLEDQSNPLLLLEYCEKGTLENYLIVKSAKEQKIKFPVKMQHVTELALGMTFLHKCTPPIVHRDLKPSNVLLTKDLHIKITDFGLAKFFPGSFNQDKYRMTGETGSYRYMAPEVFKHEEYDEKVDVYAFAFIAYWIMSSIQPFSHISNPLDAVTLAAMDEVRPPKTHIKHKEMEAIITECWSQDSNLRPSFEEILERVQGIETKKRGFF